MQNKRCKGNSGQALIEQTLLMGALIVGFLLLIPFYASPALSGALRPLGKLGTPVKGKPTPSTSNEWRASIWSSSRAGAGLMRQKPVLVAKHSKKIVRRPAKAARAEVKRLGADVAVQLTADDREALLEFLATRSDSSVDVLRARTLLMAADGKSSRIIAGTLGIDEDVVNDWRATFMARPARCGFEGTRIACRHDFPWASLDATMEPVVVSALSAEVSQ